MAALNGIFSWVVAPGASITINETPADMRLSQVALDSELVDNKRTSLKLTYNPIPTGFDSDSDDEEEAELEQESVDVVLANLVPGVIESQLLGGFVIPENSNITLSVTGQNTVHVIANAVVLEHDDLSSYGSEFASEDEEDDEEELDESEIAGMTPAEKNRFLKSLTRDADKAVANAKSSSKGAKANVPAKPAVEKTAVKKVVTDQVTPTITKPAEGKNAGQDKKRRASDAQEKQDVKKAKVADQQQSLAPKPTVAASDAKPGKKSGDSTEPKSGDQGKKQKVVKFTTQNGVQILEPTTGTGAEAKKGNKLSMRYILKLENGKVVDKNVSGAPFKFRLGAGEVIKGWDEGLLGMKVGSERKLVVPPQLGYGKKAQQGIPGNSTLIFEVKLLEIVKK